MCDEGPRFSVKEYRFAEEPDEQEREEPRPELVVLIPEVPPDSSLFLCIQTNTATPLILGIIVFYGAAKDHRRGLLFQVLDSQYGMYVWPCAVVLAQYLWFHRRMLPGKRILEIGAGTSLPGIVAAKCGAEVILSDTEELPQCLKNCERSCRINNLLGVHIIGLTWGQISPNLISLPQVDIILASDVFFEPEDFEEVITTVYFLMKRNPDAQFWTTYQVRSSDWSIEALLYKWKLKNIHVPLWSFNADKEQLATSLLPGRHTIEMMIISLAGASYTSVSTSC